MPLVDVLAEMEWTGITIDVAWFASLKERFERERKRVEQEIYAAAGEEFNINSNPQLREILFEKLNLPVLKKTSDRRVDRRERAPAARRRRTPAARAADGVSRARRSSRARTSTRCRATSIRRPAALHTSFNQTVAATGRLSSSDPNLQNIPIRRELGRDIRRGFIPRTGLDARSPPTTRRSSCACSRISRAIRRSFRRFSRAATFTGRRRR